MKVSARFVVSIYFALKAFPSIVDAFTESTPTPLSYLPSPRSFHLYSPRHQFSCAKSITLNMVQDKTGDQISSSSSELLKLDAPIPASRTEKSLITKIGSTTSMVVAGTFYLVLVWKRDVLMTSFFIGSICNGILSKVLKKFLNQERPSELVESKLDLPPSDNGMPSSHAMSLGFIGTFTALQLPWTTVPLILYVVVSLVYRVQSKLHTVDQIAVGIIVGSLNGSIWRTLCFGTNPFGINVMDWVSNHFLNDQGLLPWYGLAVPALVGAAVVGSVERRISRFLSQRTKME